MLCACARTARTESAADIEAPTETRTEAPSETPTETGAAPTDPLVRRFADQVLAEDFDPVVVTEDHALCMGRLLAAELPTERFEQILDEDEQDRDAYEVRYSPAEVNTLATAYVECLDLTPLIELHLAEIDELDPSPLLDCLARSLSESEFQLAIMKPGLTSAFYGTVKQLCAPAYDEPEGAATTTTVE